MARKFLTHIDMNLNQLLNALAHLLASDPGSPTEGQFWYNTTDRLLKYRNNTSTVILYDSDTANTANRLVRRDGSGNFAANVITAATVTGLSTPTGATDAANKGYVDAVKTGLDIKDSVRAATAAALPAHTRSGNVLTASANGAIPAQDGVTLVLNDRLLVKDEGSGTHLENGLYFVSAVGDASNPWTLTRTTDADSSAEVTGGLYAFVTEGTANADAGFILTTNDPITLNTTALSFTQFSGAGQIIAGAGLTKTGNTLNVGQGSGIIVNADDVAIDTAVVVRKYATDVGDGSAVSITITHNLGTRDVHVMLRDNTTPFAFMMPDIEAATTNTVILRFSVAPTTNQYRAIVHA